MRMHWRDGKEESHATHSGHPPFRGEQVTTLCGLWMQADSPYPVLPTCEACEEVILDMEGR